MHVSGTRCAAALFLKSIAAQKDTVNIQVFREQEKIRILPVCDGALAVIHSNQSCRIFRKERQQFLQRISGKFFQIAQRPDLRKRAARPRAV